MSKIHELSISQLKQLIAIKEKIAQLEAELASLIGTPASTSIPTRKKGGMSAAGRAAVAAAQKARWAKLKGLTQASAPAVKPAKKKFTMSAAAKAAISEAAKARWAKKKAAKK